MMRLEDYSGEGINTPCSSGEGMNRIPSSLTNQESKPNQTQRNARKKEEPSFPQALWESSCCCVSSRLDTLFNGCLMLRFLRIYILNISTKILAKKTEKNDAFYRLDFSFPGHIWYIRKENARLWCSSIYSHGPIALCKKGLL